MHGIVRRFRAVLVDRDNARGALLVEILIALALLGMIAVVFVGGMYTSLSAARLTDERSVGLTLAKSQIEFVKAGSYSDNDWEYVVDTSEASFVTEPSWWGTNPPAILDTEYAGYSVLVSGVSNIDLDEDGTPDEGIRTITAVALHDGEEVFRLQNYEVHR